MCCSSAPDAQKKIADFSDAALEAVKTQDTGEVGEMLVNLVTELKGFESDAGGAQGPAPPVLQRQRAHGGHEGRYTKVSGNVENIAASLEQYQVQLLKDVAMFNRLYQQNADYFRQLTLYIIAGDEKLEQVREGELKALLDKAEASRGRHGRAEGQRPGRPVRPL